MSRVGQCIDNAQLNPFGVNSNVKNIIWIPMIHIKHGNNRLMNIFIFITISVIRKN